MKKLKTTMKKAAGYTLATAAEQTGNAVCLAGTAVVVSGNIILQASNGLKAAADYGYGMAGSEYRTCKALVTSEQLHAELVKLGVDFSAAQEVKVAIPAEIKEEIEKEMAAEAAV